MKELYVPYEAGGFRIDVFLANYADDVASRSVAQKLIDLGLVLVGGKAVQKRHILKQGDNVRYIPYKSPCKTAVAENIPIDVIYEDDDIIVLNKQKGMVVHPAVGHYSGTLVNALLFHAKNKLSSIGGEARPGIVHRLDKDTSGLMAVAKNDRAHVILAEQLAARKMGRTYAAICHGRLKQECMTIDLPIGRHPKDRKKMAVASINKGKPAITHVKVNEIFEAQNKSFTLIEAKLSTGRTHQIRVHMAHVNHPILGDEVYGMTKNGGQGQILHANKLSLTHPKTSESMEFVAPLPEYFIKALQHIKLASKNLV